MPAAPQTLRTRVLLIGAPIAALAIALAAFLANRSVRNELETATAVRLREATDRAVAALDGYLRDRDNNLRMLGQAPGVVDALRRAERDALRLGLDRLPTATLEERFAGGRTLLSDGAVSRYLAEYRDVFDFGEIFVTELRGLTVLASNPTSDFVQSDEAWWQTAFDTGAFLGEPTFDASAGVVGVEMARRVDDPTTGNPVGIIKGVVRLRELATELTQSGSLTATSVEVVDRAGRVLISADTARLLRPMLHSERIPLGEAVAIVTVRPTDGESELVASAPAGRLSWWVVLREPLSTAEAVAIAVDRTIYVAAAFSLVLIIGLILWVTDWLNRRVTRPVTVAGQVASRVADGDLSVSVAVDERGSQEVSQLMNAVQAMVTALRRLVGQIRTASEESAAMAEEISASTQQMSASTQEMANTCQTLTSQATEQAELVRAATEQAAKILGIARTLADGSKTAAGSNAALKETAARHREQLIEGSNELAQLASGLDQASKDAGTLLTKSQEIERFVTQARAIASQTNMLALNAAIEASRAGGGEGRGFAVVADEVRKLATQAAQSAATTAQTVRDVLESVQTTHDRLTQLAAASSSVRAIAQAAAEGLGTVASGAEETSVWTDEISAASTQLRRLVEEITGRLETISGGTESVVAAAEQIAASAEQQSASTEEIAGSASQLAEAADKLTAAVSEFKLLGGVKGTPRATAA